MAPIDPTTCSEFEDRLSEYLDGELSPLARIRVAMHLSACEPCAREARELAALIRAVHRLGRHATRWSGGPRRA